MAGVDGEMAVQVCQCLVQFHQVRTIAPNGQVPGLISRLRQHQQEFMFFSMGLEVGQHLLGTAASTMEHDQQLDRFRGIQSFRDIQHRIPFTRFAAGSFQFMESGWQWFSRCRLRLERQVPKDRGGQETVDAGFCWEFAVHRFCQVKVIVQCGLV